MKLRPMTMADADKMLEWKNYSETRQFAIQTHDEIKREDHYKWLPNNIQYFQVIESNDGKTVGAVRIQDNEISIWVDRNFRNEGVATLALLAVHLQRTTEWGSEVLTAKIVDGNISSLRAFIKAGFLPISHQDSYYIFQK